MVVTAELLKKFLILESLTEAQLKDLAEHSKVKKYNRRGIVLTADNREDCLCFLFEGRLQGVDFTIDGREVGLYFVEPGEFCGELALFDQNPQVEHVIALTPSVTVAIPLAKMHETMTQNPEILSFLSTKLAGRIREMTFQRSLLSLPNIGHRVCCQLWSLLPKQDKIKAKKSAIINPPTHMEIAIMLNVSRETVSRIFQTLQNQEVVRRDGSARLEINCVETLKNLAEGAQEV
jgi:CRP-like cAMP-binding protein